MGMLKKRLKKILLVVFIKLKEKSISQNNHKLSYLFFPSKNKTNNKDLIVIFSGFAGEKDSAKYNLIRTLYKNKANRLYILDDFGYQKQGSYYLGEDGKFFVQEMVEKLINEIIVQKNIKNTIFCGISKGGAAAIYYGLRLDADSVISGSPQYLIGDYLNQNERHRMILNSITGERNPINARVTILNNLIKNEIEKKRIKTKVYLHYSVNEESYEIDVKYLINDLKINGYELEEDKAEYNNHGEVGVYFQPYLLRTISKLIC